MKHIASFSGGKDSTAMLITIRENNLPLDEIVYADVGSWMWDEINLHLKQVEQYMGMPITIIDISENIDEGFKKWGFPSMMIRWCTGEKITAINRHIKQYDEVTQYVGFAADEIKRTEKNKYKGIVNYPLIDYDITEAQALKLCYDHGFDFGGIYEHHSRLNCWCCPLQKINELKYIFFNCPDKWEELRQMQLRTHGTFYTTKSIFELEHKFWDEMYSRKKIKAK
jgi:3'-phosphoadenosine 5'-phosphosulfate sulfotransferase (PAPS reductase)/FAD synthetase